MNKFTFKTDRESEQYCLEIAEEMINNFHIELDEAIGRINRMWIKRQFIGNDLKYHELPEDWAYIIYYGHDSLWWKRKNDPTLKPIPYP